MKPHSRPHVLYIDDDAESCGMMKALLGYSNIQVTCVKNIRETLELADKVDFDLFLLDLWLDDGNGDDLCRHLQRIYPQIPVVFYTGCASEREKQIGLAAGAVAYIVKPYSDLVAPAIERLTKRSVAAPAFVGIGPFSARGWDPVRALDF